MIVSAKNLHLVMVAPVASGIFGDAAFLAAHPGATPPIEADAGNESSSVAVVPEPQARMR